MKDKEVLQKAIEKIATSTIEDGFEKVVIGCENIYVNFGLKKSEVVLQFLNTYIYEQHDDIEFLNSWNVKGFLLSPDFAKAFWGEDTNEEYVEKIIRLESHHYYISKWQYHLQQMVLEKNPIDYLRKFINTEKQK